MLAKIKKQGRALRNGSKVFVTFTFWPSRKRYKIVRFEQEMKMRSAMRPISWKKTLFTTSMLFSALSLLAMTPAYCGEDNPDAKQGDPWALAEAALAKHIAPLVEELRVKFDDPRAQYAEYSSALLKKYLPNHRVYAQDCIGSPNSMKSVFILDRKGSIVPLADADVAIEASDDDGFASKLKGITDVIRAQSIKIENADVAIDVLNLTEEVQRASNYISSLRIRTNNYKVFDKDVILGLSNSGHKRGQFAYSATKRDGGWTVKATFVRMSGLSVTLPILYEIDVNEKQEFRAIRIRAQAAPPPDEPPMINIDRI